MKTPQKILDFAGEPAFRAPEDTPDFDLDFGGDLDLAGFSLDGSVATTDQITEELSLPRRVTWNTAGVSASHAVDLAERMLGSGPGQMHAILAGTFIFGDFIQAVVDQIGPAYVRISTLSYSADNVDSLWTLFRDEKISHLDFMTSDMFYAHYRQTLWKMLVTSLPRDKCRYAVAGMHAKVCVIEGQGKTVVVEGSANLRSCQNVEQVLLSVDDPEAVRFHSKWMDLILGRFGLTWQKLGNKDVWSAITGA